MATNTSDVIIVGGGVHGTAAAYELARAGVRVVLFEKGYLSSGASGRSGAGLRQHFGTEINLQLARYNLSVFPTLEAELDTGMKLEFTQWGYLWVAYTESCLAQLKKNVTLQQGMQIPSVIMEPGEMKAGWPYLCLDGIIGGAFCGEDGHINPHTLTMSYGHAAQRLGATIRKFTPVRRLLAERGKILGILTESGEEWHAPVVLLVAGAWSPQLAATVGVELPVYAERHNMLVTEPMELVKCPLVLCLDDGAYFKQCPNGTFTMGRDDPNEPQTVECGNSEKFLQGVTESVLKRFPAISGVRVVRQWSGPYDITPDHQAIIDWTPVEGLLVNCGWSGHGLQFAPSASRLCREMIMGGKTFVDIRRFRLSRFAENDLYFEPACI